MKDMPMTVRRSIEVLGLCAAGFIIVVGKTVIMPLLMAFFFSLLLLPVYRWLARHKVPNALAIILSIATLIVVVAGIFTFLSIQVGSLLNDIPQIQQTLMMHWQSLSGWISERWHVSTQQQMATINKQVGSLGGNVTNYLSGAMGSLSNVLIFVGLMPIYIFLMLFYKDLLLNFVYLWFRKEDHKQLETALRETEVMVKHYLIGLLIQITYLTILLGGILLLFGIKHAILIGVVFAILNLIPYIGALIGNVIGVVLTLTSSQELWQIWVVLGTIAFVQFLDNNILMPRIVGSKVKVNALASIVGIFIGGMLAGISGMFLSIPVMAILKIAFDKSPYLYQWGVLLGEPEDNMKPRGGAFVSRVKRSMERKRDIEIRRKEQKDDQEQ